MDIVPAAISSLSALESLTIRQSRLPSNPEGIGELTNLRTLVLKCCAELQQLPSSLGRLSSLTRLDIYKCPIVNLPEGLCQLGELRELTLRCCYELTKLPDLITQLICLEMLKVQMCTKLSSAPQAMGNLSCLRELDLTGCVLLKEKLESLPWTLETLRLGNDTSSITLPGMSTAPNLKELQLINVTVMDAAATSRSLSGIKKLELRLGAEQREIPLLLGFLSCLRELRISNAKSLQHLPHDIGSLPQLRQLHVEGAETLTMIAESLSWLVQLTSLHIEAPNLTHLPETLSSLSRLGDLSLQNCSSLTALPCSFTALTYLHKLDLSKTPLHVLPPNFHRWGRLRELDLSDCEQLHFLPQELCCLTMLRHLDLRGCEMPLAFHTPAPGAGGPSGASSGETSGATSDSDNLRVTERQQALKLRLQQKQRAREGAGGKTNNGHGGKSMKDANESSRGGGGKIGTGGGGDGRSNGRNGSQVNHGSDAAKKRYDFVRYPLIRLIHRTRDCSPVTEKLLGGVGLDLVAEMAGKLTDSKLTDGTGSSVTAVAASQLGALHDVIFTIEEPAEKLPASAAAVGGAVGKMMGGKQKLPRDPPWVRVMAQDENQQQHVFLVPPHLLPPTRLCVSHPGPAISVSPPPHPHHACSSREQQHALHFEPRTIATDGYCSYHEAGHALVVGALSPLARVEGVYLEDEGQSAAPGGPYRPVKYTGGTDIVWRGEIQPMPLRQVVVHAMAVWLAGMRRPVSALLALAMLPVPVVSPVSRPHRRQAAEELIFGRFPLPSPLMPTPSAAALATAFALICRAPEVWGAAPTAPQAGTPQAGTTQEREDQASSESEAEFQQQQQLLLQSAIHTPRITGWHVPSSAAFSDLFGAGPQDLRAWPERLEMRGGQEGLREGVEEGKAEAAAGAGKMGGAAVAATAAVRRVGRGLEMPGVAGVREAMTLASSTLRQHESALHAIAWRLVDAGEASESEITAAAGGNVVAGANVNTQHKAHESALHAIVWRLVDAGEASEGKIAAAVASCNNEYKAVVPSPAAAAAAGLYIQLLQGDSLKAMLQVVQEAMALACCTLRQHESALHAIAWRLVDAGEASESEIAAAVTSAAAGAVDNMQHEAVNQPAGAPAAVAAG
ncbi:unnamed protein product [Closterium sp. Naga37s-1]|nr:unnamed protein product [Closterium sp. Naga37s-1]